MKIHEILDSVILTEDELYEMTSFRPNKTGIERVVIWMGPKQIGAASHGPRVKVSASYTIHVKPDDLFVMTVSKNPEIVAGVCNLKNNSLEQVKQWIITNYDILIKFWNYQIDDDVVKEKVKKI